MLLPLIRATDIEAIDELSSTAPTIGAVVRIVAYSALIALGLGIGAVLGFIAAMAFGLVDLC